MHTALIRETIQLDKNAREKVEALNKEKENLEARIKTDEKAIVLKHKQDIEKLILDTKQTYEAEIESKHINERIKFDKMCDEIKKAFEEKEAEWIESIYAFCIE